MPYATPHQLRHGGASADGLRQVSDQELMSRGTWASAKSLTRYRQPARYLRRLALLTPQQIASASAAPAMLVKKLVSNMLLESRRETEGVVERAAKRAAAATEARRKVGAASAKRRRQCG